MARRPRNAPGGWIYHVLNRSVGRMKIFNSEGDFRAFLRILKEAQDRVPIRILSYCVMSNHWHFVVWPREDGELADFFRWMTLTHVMRWRTAHQKVGYGPLYQGRFKSFPVKKDEDFLRVCRFVERNPLTAGLVERAEDWRWGSLGQREGVLAGMQNAGEVAGATLGVDSGGNVSGQRGVGRTTTLASEDAGPSAFVSEYGQRSASLLQACALRPVTDCNCVAVRRGGEQQEVKDWPVMRTLTDASR